MLSFVRYLILTCLLLGYTHGLQASLKEDRAHFLKAETAINKGDLKAWKKLQPKLVDYPLYADLLFKLSIQKIDKTDEKQAKQNLQALANTPLHKTYLKSWLRRLVSRQQWNQYIDYYESGLGTRYQCHYAQALYESGQADKAEPVARKLWLVAKSQPKYCDPVFKDMKTAGQLTDDLVWQRIELAIRKGKTGLVKYLKKSLPAYDQKQVDEWLKIRNKPERALAKKYTQSELPRRQQMLVYGVKRMALFEADRALAQWQKIRDKVLLTAQDKQEIERYLALRMTTQRLDGAVAQHRRITAPDREILEWGVRAALREGDWQAVGDFLNKLEQTGSLSDRWKYWQARHAEEAGKSTLASSLYHLLATGRGYHNFLAADRTDTSYLFNHQPLSYSKQQIRPLAEDYNVRRARELYELDRISQARREWYYLIKNHGDEDRQKLAYIQKQWGWHSQAILTIATADYYDDLSLRFPVVYKDEIEKAIRSSGLDTSWVMALMRQESAFQADARSSAGARGLMQLMPQTSRYVARLLKLRRPKINDLYQPATNIKLGTHYLKKNLKDFKQNKVLTTAAYNAGPTRVSKWLPTTKNMEADVWTETIPFKETRLYVQRIMSYASIYDHKLGYDITRVSQRMQDIYTDPITASNP
jgi:soluble lytic murein transglycosylase